MQIPATSPVGPDLVVAGAGGGLAGALRAAELGLRVLVVEASPHFAHGNNTSMSTSMIPGAGTRWQRQLGIEDSPETFFADLMHKTKGEGDPAASQALAEVSARLVTWLADYVGLPVELATDFPYPGHSELRCHTVPGRTGTRLLQCLLDAVERQDGLDLLVPARLTGVRTTGAGEVSAAVVTYPDGTDEEIPCRAVLLATNGFGADPDMVRRHMPEIADAVYHGSVESKGDAVRIAGDLGAELAFMDAYQGHAALATPYATLVGWATVMHGAVLVNNDGQRFGNETQGYSEYAREVLAQPGGTAIVVLDQRVFDACLLFDDFRQSVDSGALRWADDVPSLAAAFDLPPEALGATLASAHTHAVAGTTDELGRSHWEHPLEPPLAGARVTAALFHTQGGPRVDQHARVLRHDGTPIRGLYASGGAAAGISGHGPAGYLAGNGLLPALGLAFLAAEHAAEEAGHPAPTAQSEQSDTT